MLEPSFLSIADRTGKVEDKVKMRVQPTADRRHGRLDI